MSDARDYGLQPGATNPQAAATIRHDRDRPVKKKEIRDFDAFKAARQITADSYKVGKNYIKAELTDNDYTELGARGRKQADNLILQSWAAEFIGEGYPLNKAQTEIIFNLLSDNKALGEAICKWIKDNKQ